MDCESRCECSYLEAHKMSPAEAGLEGAVSVA
jgi:hypothetical protein